jgi:hypothetical protein
LRELDLQLGFARARARREDVENQLGAIHHALAGRILDVLALRRCELVIEDDERCVHLFDERAELVDLPFAEIRRRIRSVDLLRDAADDDRARRIDELLELLEMLVDVMARRCAFSRRANEQCPLERSRERDQIASDTKLLRGCPEVNLSFRAQSSSRAEWSFRAKRGMTTAHSAASSRFPLPVSRFPLPASRFPLPASRFPLPAYRARPLSVENRPV